MKKSLLIFIAITLVFIFICVAWSAVNQEKTNAQLERWDRILEEVANGK